MLSVADARLFLGRYGDLLGLLTVLPLLSELKFGAILRAHEQIKPVKEETSDGAEELATNESKGDKEKVKEPASKGKSKKKDDKVQPAAKSQAAQAEGQATEAAAVAVPDLAAAADGGDAAAAPASTSDALLPPIWACALLVLAEVLTALPLFDPSDKLTRRAAGKLMRVQAIGKDGFAGAVSSIDKVLQDTDVYALVVAMASIVGVGTVLLCIVLGLNKQEQMILASPLKVARQCTSWVVKGIFLAPRLWAGVLLACWTIIAARSSLAKLVKKSAVKELLASSAVLWRTGGTVGTAMSNPRKGPLPLWATLSCAAGVVRTLHFIVVERVSWDAVTSSVEPGDAPANVLAARCMVALEVWSFLALAPHIGLRRSNLFLLAFLVLPCACAVLESGSGGVVAQLEPLVADLAPRLGMAVAAIGFVSIFMGGFPTMICCVGLAQALIKLHSLTTVKA